MPKSKAARRSYHHGDRRAALIRATTEMVAEQGLPAFTVAEAARRSGVSSGAPFRHFADREELLTAAGTAAVEELVERYRAAISTAAGPAEALGAVSAAFVSFAAENPGGFELQSGAGYLTRRHVELQDARRALADLLVPIGLELARDHDAALELIGAQYALALGFATLAVRRAYEPRGEEAGSVAARARQATLAMVAGWPAR
jgi:AcrR family transcriptional regulator